jgi:hypothetical protein
MRMENVGRFSEKPTMQADPPAGIGEAFAHLEAHEGGSVVDELVSRFAARSGKSNHSDSPIPAQETFGEKKHLPLGPGQAVERGNDEGDVVHCGQR